MGDKFDKSTKIISLVFSFVALIVSVIALTINRNGYNINKEKFNIDTVENLTISVGIESFESINLKLEENDKAPSYLIGISICFVNYSNLPIYINKEYISREQYSNGVYGTQILRTPVEIEQLDLPILVEPQETKYVDCYIRITIPEDVNQYIVEEFSDTNNLEITEIGTYLFFEKNTDLIGNKLEISNKDGNKHYKYNPTIPFEISFWTTRGNYFSTEFYEGLYIDIKNAMEKYDNIDFEVSYGEDTKIELVLDFVKNHAIIVILVLVATIFIEYIFLKKVYKKHNSREQIENDTEK